MASETIMFLASLPPIQSAIKIGLDGGRVQFDLPETERESLKRLIDCNGKVLRVTVEVVSDTWPTN